MCLRIQICVMHLFTDLFLITVIWYDEWLFESTPTCHIHHWCLQGKSFTTSFWTEISQPYKPQRSCMPIDSIDCSKGIPQAHPQSKMH